MAEHVYALSADTVAPGIWRAYCLACSTETDEYVHPCKLADTPPPPTHLLSAVGARTVWRVVHHTGLGYDVSSLDQGIQYAAGNDARVERQHITNPEVVWQPGGVA